MKIEPFENINCDNEKIETNSNKIDASKTSGINNLFLKFLTPDVITNLSNILLPLLNKKDNKQNDKIIVETNQYAEIEENENNCANTTYNNLNIEDKIENAENLGKYKDDLPLTNSQLDISNLFNIDKGKGNNNKNKLSNTNFEKYHFNIRKKIAISKVEEHRKIINSLNNKMK